MDYSIRRMEEKDIPSIAKLEEECLKSPWNEDQIRYELNENPVSNILILEKEVGIVGYIDFFITFDSASIARVAVTPKERRKGYAEALLREMDRICKENKVEFITLEVRTSNEVARKMYEKCGYEYIVKKKAYYDDGEDAEYMVRCL